MPTNHQETQNEIKTKPYSPEYSNGWERCFLKKPQEWLDSLYPHLIVKSPDGFRCGDGVDWETPMRRKEFEHRLTYCTILNTITDNTLYQMPESWIEKAEQRNPEIWK